MDPTPGSKPRNRGHTAIIDRGRLTRPGFRAIHGCVVAALVCSVLAPGARADDAGPEYSAGDRVNYSAGYAFGDYLAGLRRQGITAKPEAIFRGVLDALAGAEPSVSQAEMRKALEVLQEAAADLPEETGSAQTLPPARIRGFVDDFARLNAQRPGVVTLPSGVQYEILRQGSGQAPGPSDSVRISYTATLSNGVAFDSTDEDGGPIRMRMDEIIVPGLKEALLLMQEGARWRVVIPPHMGFGASGKKLLRKRDLIYEIELVAVEPSEPQATPATPHPGAAEGGQAATPTTD